MGIEDNRLSYRVSAILGWFIVIVSFIAGIVGYTTDKLGYTKSIIAVEIGWVHAEAPVLFFIFGILLLMPNIYYNVNIVRALLLVREIRKLSVTTMDKVKKASEILDDDVSEK
jgi:hypothetical protein